MDPTGIKNKLEKLVNQIKDKSWYNPKFYYFSIEIGNNNVKTLHINVSAFISDKIDFSITRAEDFYKAVSYILEIINFDFNGIDVLEFNYMLGRTNYIAQN